MDIGKENFFHAWEVKANVLSTGLVKCEIQIRISLLYGSLYTCRLTMIIIYHLACILHTCQSYAHI